MDRDAYVGLHEMNAAPGTLKGMPDLPADMPAQSLTVEAVSKLLHHFLVISGILRGYQTKQAAAPKWNCRFVSRVLTVSCEKN